MATPEHFKQLSESIGGDNDANVALQAVELVGGSAGSFVSNAIARVDQSGDDTTGVVGDLLKPFLTTQGAIDAIEAGSFDFPLLDIGNNSLDGFTTSLPFLAIKGEFTDSDAGSKGAKIGTEIVSTSVDSPVVLLSGLSTLDITFANGSAPSVYLANNAQVLGTISVAGSDLYVIGSGFDCYVSRVTAGNGQAANLRDLRVGNAGVGQAHDVQLVRCLADTVSVVGLVLIDSRPTGNGTWTFTNVYYLDQLLTNIVFPDSDPHVAGAGYWVAGVLTKSAG